MKKLYLALAKSAGLAGRPLGWPKNKFASLIYSLCILGLPNMGFSDDQTAAYTLADGRSVAPLERFRDCEACPEMIAMPLGSFLFGASEGETRNRIYGLYGKLLAGNPPDELIAPKIIPTEHPRHPVAIDIPFAIGRNEVTHGEWMACVTAGGCSHVPDHRVFTKLGNDRPRYVPLGPEHPVMNVSYLNILEYVDWINAQVGADVYRLPTEAEWEYAARAGTQTRFAQGDDLTPDQANFSRAGTEQLRGKPMPELTNRRIPVRVNELDAANAWGVRHMSGNVREITQSCWSETHLGLATSSAYLDLVRSQGTCQRVVKGGAVNSAMDFGRPAHRGRAKETTDLDSTGFRLVRQSSIKQ